MYVCILFGFCKNGVVIGPGERKIQNSISNKTCSMTKPLSESYYYDCILSERLRPSHPQNLDDLWHVTKSNSEAPFLKSEKWDASLP